jgi:hypothetical protein
MGQQRGGHEAGEQGGGEGETMHRETSRLRMAAR